MLCLHSVQHPGIQKRWKCYPISKSRLLRTFASETHIAIGTVSDLRLAAYSLWSEKIICWHVSHARWEPLTLMLLSECAPAAKPYSVSCGEPRWTELFAYFMGKVVLPLEPRWSVLVVTRRQPISFESATSNGDTGGLTSVTRWLVAGRMRNWHARIIIKSRK